MKRIRHTIRKQSDIARHLGTGLAKSMAQLALPLARRTPVWLEVAENSGALLVGPGDELHVFRLSRSGDAPVALGIDRGSDNIADFFRPAGLVGDLMPAKDEVLLFALIQEVGSGKPRRWTATAAVGPQVSFGLVLEDEEKEMEDLTSKYY